MKKILALSLVLLLSACSPNMFKGTPPFPKITKEEQYLLDNPPAALTRAIEKHLPRARAELLKAEAIALSKGEKLSADELKLAIAVGVKHPEKIRILVTSDFPINEEENAYGTVIALTMNYGIFVKPGILFHREAYLEVITHEFAHVVQFETYGIDGMSRRFFIEKTILGDKLIPIEREAIIAGNKVYDDPETVYGY